jgi:hypothetical protein
MTASGAIAEAWPASVIMVPADAAQARAGANVADDLLRGRHQPAGRVQLDDNDFCVALFSDFDAAADILPHGWHDGTFRGQDNGKRFIPLRARGAGKDAQQTQQQQKNAQNLHNLIISRPPV